jgi:cytochrome P450
MLAFGEHPALLMLIDQDGQVRWRRWQERLGRLAPWPWFQRRLDRIDVLLLEEIRRRRTARAGDDVLSMLLAARDERGLGLTDDALLDEMKTLLVAGHETTATSLTWAVLELLRHPDVLARLRDELAAGKDDYLDAVIKESLRLRPIVPMVGRVLQAPARVGGHDYPAGVALVPNIYLTQRRSTEWPDPARFNPDRFLGKRASPYEYFPFGGGARRCIGMAFALFEMRIVLRQVVMGARLSLAPRYRPRLVRRGVTFAVSKGLRVVQES